MTPKDYFYNPAFCPLPWIGVFVNPDGSVRNCAVTTETLGNIHEHSISSCVQGSKNIQIKTDMLAKQQHSRCDVCYKTDALSDNINMSESNRNWYKRIGIKDISMDHYSQPDNFKLKVLDLRWRNTCNLACVYCGPDLSSRWASELGETKFRIERPVLDENKKFILENLDQVSHVYLAGGEPLLMKENFELLTELKKCNPLTEIRINTNLTVIDNEIFELLCTFKNVKWTVSVETTEAQFEYIRYPAKWSQFYSNLMEIQKRGFDINFNMVWFAFNAFSIFDCVEHLKASGFHENTFIIQCLNDPNDLDLRNLSSYTLANVKNVLASKLNTANPNYWLYRSYKTMLRFIEQPFDSDFNRVAKQFAWFDQHRNLNSQHTFPEIYN